MQFKLSKINLQWQKIAYKWRCFWLTYHHYHHIEQLENLKQWANKKGRKSKRFLKIAAYYQFIQNQKSMRLMDYSLRYPSLAQYSRLLYKLIRLVSPEPRYYRGAARMYRLSNLRY